MRALMSEAAERSDPVQFEDQLAILADRERKRAGCNERSGLHDA
jgi:hypothetical protein